MVVCCSALLHDKMGAFVVLLLLAAVGGAVAYKLGYLDRYIAQAQQKFGQ